MQKIYPVLALIIALLPFHTHAAPLATRTPAEISQEITTQGAKSVVDELEKQGNYDDIIDKISAGKSEWVTLAPELAKGTDAGTSEELTIALALALPLNASAVLTILDAHVPPLNPAAVCSTPFVEDTVPDIPAYIRRSIKALESVKDINLKSQQDACLVALHQAATLPTDNP